MAQANIVDNFWDAAERVKRLDRGLISDELDTFSRAQKLLADAYRIDEDQTIRPSREERKIIENQYVIDTTPARTEYTKSGYDLGTLTKQEQLNQLRDDLSLKALRDQDIAARQDAGISTDLDEVYGALRNAPELNARQRALADQEWQRTARSKAGELLVAGDIQGAMTKLAPFLPQGFSITPPEIAGGDYEVDTGNKFKQKLSYPAVVNLLNDISAKTRQGLKNLNETESLDKKLERRALELSMLGRNAQALQNLRNFGKFGTLPSVVSRASESQGTTQGTPQGTQRNQSTGIASQEFPMTRFDAAIPQQSIDNTNQLLDLGQDQQNLVSAPIATPQQQGIFPPSFPGAGQPETELERKQKILEAYSSGKFNLQDRNALFDIYNQEYPGGDFFADLTAYERNKQFLLENNALLNKIRSEKNLRSDRQRSAEAELLAKQAERQQRISELRKLLER